jgi:hypothetical protein
MTFKRTVKKADQEEVLKDMEAVKKETDAALQRNKSLPSPRSFDFGLPTIPKDSTPIMPQRWI